MNKRGKGKFVLSIGCVWRNLSRCAACTSMRSHGAPCVLLDARQACAACRMSSHGCLTSCHRFSPLVHCTAGAAAGAIASGLLNPLDVVKTRLQTMGEVRTALHSRGRTLPCGIPCGCGIPGCAGYHAVRDTMPLRDTRLCGIVRGTVPCGIPCRVGYHAVRDTIAAWQVGVHYSGPVAAARVVLAQEGMAGFFRGATVRIGRTGCTRTRSTGRSRR